MLSAYLGDLEQKSDERIAYLTLEKNEVCPFDIENSDVTYMSTTSVLFAKMTLPSLLLATSVRYGRAHPSSFF